MLHNLILPTALPYFLMGLLAMAEGPAAILLSGAAISAGALLPLPVYLAIILGNLSADIGWVLLGRSRKLGWLVWLGQQGKVDEKQIEQLGQRVQQYAPRLLFLSKLTVGFPIPTLIATGLSQAPVQRWIGMLVLGELIKSAALLGVGYLFAQAIGQATAWVQVVLWGLTLAAAVGGMILFKKRAARRQGG